MTPLWVGLGVGSRGFKEHFAVAAKLVYGGGFD